MPQFEDVGDEWMDFTSHVFLDIQTLEEAKAYVDGIIDLSSNQEILEYVNIYFSHTKKKKTQKRQRLHGGNKVLECDDGHELDIYLFLAALDSAHDLCKKTEQGELEYNISVDAIVNLVGCKIPSGISKRDMVNEQSMIGFLSSNEYLAFGDVTYKNPVMNNGIGFFDKSKYSRLGTYIDSFDNIDNNPRNKYCCVVAETETGPKISAKQILLLISSVATWFGDGCEFQHDNDQKCTKVFNALKVLNIAWYNKLTDGSITFPEFVKRMKHIIVQKPKWVSYVTDSKMFDGTPHLVDIEYDTRSTGWVYRHDSGIANICLEGIDHSYRICFSCQGQDKQCLSRNQAYQKHSTAMLIHTLSFANAVSFKRAGDWGQVEHCKRYDKIFITFDRLAALYAYYRNVKFIYVRFIQKKTTTRNNWTQFAFLLSHALST